MLHQRLLCAVPLLIAGSALMAQTASSGAISVSSIGDVPAIVGQANDLGRVAPDTDMNVMVWLKGRGEADFDKAVDRIYTPGSAAYHKWMTAADVAKYAPAQADLQTVKKELESHGLSVTADPTGYALIAHGQAANVETAFNTQIKNFSVNGKTFQSNATSAVLTGAAGSLVASVSGLSTSVMHPLLVAQKDAATGKALPPTPLSKIQASGGFSSFITDSCFKKPITLEFTTPSASDLLPIAIYYGNLYDTGPTLHCGYSVPQLAAIYGVDAAAKQGLKGQGQTIVIVDAFGSPTILADANLFSALSGLPPLDSTNFEIVSPGGPAPPMPPTLDDLQGWAQEVSLDVEWAHAMAPKAKIVLVAALSDYDSDLQYAIHYATVNHLGDVMSNSFGGPEILIPTSDLQAYNKVIKRAAAQGIAVQVSSADDGDFSVAIGMPSVSSPADSPYATSVGGTSLNIPSGKGPTTTGWGNNLSRITSATGIYDPPVNLGFVGGAGGGESSFFKKPTYQASLPGSSRQQPDVSAVADPYTGVPVVFTDILNDATKGDQFVAVFGGTSVASPVFSAIWSLADQLAGGRLGQAAPIVAQLSSPALFDVVPVSSPANVFGTITDSTGTTFYAPRDLVPPVYEPKFVSAFYPVYLTAVAGAKPTRWDVLSFGTDTSLRIEKGWDNVTGYGTPGGFSFISQAASYK